MIEHAKIFQEEQRDEQEIIDSYQEVDASDGDGQMYEHFRFVVDKGQSMLRIDKYLVLRMEHASRNRIQQAAEAHCILVNGTPVKSNYRVKPLDVVSIVMDRPRYELEIIPQDLHLDIVYEDADLLLVNKPPGLVVHPGHGNYTGTLVNGLAYHFRNDKDFDVNDPRLGLVHRIDKDTSGLLVVAKTPYAKTHLSAQFFHKTTHRKYIALVWGNVTEDTGTVVGNIARSTRDRLQMAVYDDPSIGKHAVTHYRVVERFGYVTLLECQLETGRTHQIRVHVKHIGHTLFNDARYGGDQVLKGTTFAKYKLFIQRCFELCPRQVLHAFTLGFVHPTTGKEMHFEAPLPEDITLLIERWRNYSQQKTD